MRFRVLGPVMGYGSRGAVALGSARQRTVLAALLIEPGGTVAFDQLVDRVWGEAPPQRARLTLHTYLSRLRAVLAGADGPALVRRAHGYAIEVDESAVDLHEFRALAQAARRTADDDSAARLWDDALALWRGAPFADLDSDWLRTVAVGLEAERTAAVLDRNDVLLRRGEHARLLPDLAKAAAENPLDERLAGQLMLALYRSGRQADALAHYRLLHDRLVDETGSDPGPALRELHHRVLRQDPGLAAAAQTVVPAQLPADIAGFAGRVDALAQLDALLTAAEDQVVIAAIGGGAGMGKTSLAVHWAHLVRDRFPDGQLYLNLRGFDPGGRVMSPAEALRALLELLGVPPDRIPSTVDAQAGLYRTRMTGARMLLVLDNVRDAEQVRPLLPGSPGSMVLVTSRDRLAGLVAAEGARPVRLDALATAEARQLLGGRLGARRLEADPEAADGIMEACAGLPLALAIVAARAAFHPEFGLAVFADELAGTRGRLDALTGPDTATDVRAVFSWSYRALSDDAARMFRLLGLHPGPDISTAAAASLAALPVDRAVALLRELVSANLISEHTPGRFNLHDLLRAYAGELAQTVDSAPDRHAARLRMFAYYLHAADAADKWLPASRDAQVLEPCPPGVIREHFPGNAEAGRWLSTELGTVLALVTQSDEDESAHHVQQLAFAVSTFLAWRAMWDLQLTVQSAGLRAARRLGDLLGEADLHRRLARACTMLGRDEEAYAHIRAALARSRECGDHTGLARGNLTMVLLHTREDRHREALRHAHECLSAAQAAGHRLMQALGRNAIGWCHTLLGEHEQAIAHCEHALAELTALGDVASKADVWDSLGHAHLGRGDHSRAVECYQQAIEWNRRFGNRRHEGLTLLKLGDVHRSRGDRDAAREAWRQALPILDDIGHPDADGVRRRLDDYGYSFSS